MANKHMRRCSTLLIIRDTNQNYNEVSLYTGQNGHHFKKATNNKCWRGYGENQTLLHCWWKCKLITATMENSMERLQKTRNRTTICCFSVTKSSLTVCDPVNCSIPCFPVLHYLPEFAQTHAHRVDDANQSFNPLCPLLLLSIFPSMRVFPN